MRRVEWRKFDQLSTFQAGLRRGAPRELIGTGVEVVAVKRHVTIEHERRPVARPGLVDISRGLVIDDDGWARDAH